MGKRFGLVTAFWLVAGFICAQQQLSLEDYLGQVQTKGPNFQSSQAAVEGYEKQSHQQDLPYSPVLTAGYNHLNNQSVQNFGGILLNNDTQTDTAGVSLTDKFPFG